MIGRFRVIIAAAALVAMSALGGCQVFSPIADPASVGCTEDEANECRVIAAALIVKAANLTIGESLDRSVITVQEAARLRGITRQAEAALLQARQALPFEDATTDARLAALEAILSQLLAERILAGV
jgi:hypothetical protein